MLLLMVILCGHCPEIKAISGIKLRLTYQHTQQQILLYLSQVLTVDPVIVEIWHLTILDQVNLILQLLQLYLVAWTHQLQTTMLQQILMMVLVYIRFVPHLHHIIKSSLTVHFQLDTVQISGLLLQPQDQDGYFQEILDSKRIITVEHQVHLLGSTSQDLMQVVSLRLKMLKHQHQQHQHQSLIISPIMVDMLLLLLTSCMLKHMMVHLGTSQTHYNFLLLDGTHINIH